jgi:protein-disulfide isomerase
MKKIITIVIIIAVALGFGWYLFSISGQGTVSQTGNYQINQPKVDILSEPLPVASDDFILGNKDAKNILIIYEDFQCPACANFENTLMQVPSALKDTKVAFRVFPLTNIHQNSVISSYAAYAAGEQGKFWEMAEALYKNQSEWENLSDPLPKFTDYAKGAGVSDIEKFKADITSKKFQSRLENSLKEALGLNLSGTPSIFFNGKPLELGDINKIKSQAEGLYK